MRATTWTLLAAAFAVVIIVAASALATAAHYGAFRNVEPVFEGACAPVQGVPGPEDLAFAADGGLLFVSSAERRGDGGARGAIHAFDSEDPLSQDNWRDRTGGVPERFEPHGLSLYEDGETRRLFVVNHAAGETGDGHAVEIFDIAENGDLTWVEAIPHPLMTSPNDLAAVGPRAFYASNDMANPHRSLAGVWELLSRADTASLFYYDGAQGQLAAQGLSMANGVAVSADGETLFVAETADNRIAVFARDPGTGALTPETYIHVDAGPDNLDIDDSGALWIAAHVNMFDFIAHARGPEKRTASAVYAAGPSGSGEWASDLVFADDGERLSAISVAAHSGGRIALGTVFDAKFLICDMAEDAQPTGRE